MNISTLILTLLALCPFQEEKNSKKAIDSMNEFALLQLSPDTKSDTSAQPMTRFDLQLFLRERGEHPREFSFYLHYAKKPKEIFEIVIDDIEKNTQVRKGFDGKDYWLKEQEKAKITLSGHEYTEDRNAIEDGINLCNDLILFLDFKQFAQKYPPEKVSLQEDGIKIISGKLLRKGEKWDYSIKSKGKQLPFQIDFSKRNNDKSELTFQRFELLSYKSYQGRKIPQIIYEFQLNEELPSRIYEIHDIVWGPLPSDGKKLSPNPHN